jgi:hypothetical protein
LTGLAAKCSIAAFLQDAVCCEGLQKIASPGAMDKVGGHGLF